MSIKIESASGKKGILCEGNAFKAKDKLGNINEYSYEGIERTSNGYDIHLHNRTTNTETYVEKLWFKQREIQILSF